MMEFWLSQSLSHELFLFSRWNSGYHKAFLTNFFFFSRWNSGYHKAFLTNFFFFFTMEFWLSQSRSHELFLFSRWYSRGTQFGGRLFSYISRRVFT
jgi:hypothetical protein